MKISEWIAGRVAIITVAGVLGIGTAACGAHSPVPVTTVVNKLSDATAYAQDAQLVLKGLETFEHGYFTAFPDPALQEKIDAAFADADAGIDIAIRLCQGVQDLTQEQVVNAFQTFQGAYTKLLVLLGPLGVRRDQATGAYGVPPRVSASAPGHPPYLVPDPLIFIAPRS